MTFYFTLSMGWWLAPVLVMVVGATAAWRYSLECNTGHFMDGFFLFVIWTIAFVVPSLVAWLAWAIAR